MVSLPLDDYRDDAMLTAAASNALAQNITPPRTLEAAASDGNIWLTGVVQQGPHRRDAEMTIAPLPGVRGIADDVEIVSDAPGAAESPNVSARRWSGPHHVRRQRNIRARPATARSRSLATSCPGRSATRLSMRPGAARAPSRCAMRLK